MSELAAPAVESSAPATPVAPASAPAPAASAQGMASTPQSWTSTLPAELGASPSLSKFKDVAGLAKSYVEMEKTMGARLPAPQPTWTDKEYDDLYNKLGRPEKPDDYGFKVPEDAPKGLNHTEADDKWFAGVAHKARLSTAQAKMIRDGFLENQIAAVKSFDEQNAASQAAITEGVKALQREYGPKWEQSISAANSVIKELGGQEVFEVLKKTGLDNNPTLIKMMIKIGSTLQDHSIIRGTPGVTGQFSTSPAAAASEIQRLMTDKTFVNSITNSRANDHEANLKKWNDLHQVAYPSPAR